MAARAVAFHTPLSQYDCDHDLSIVRDAVAAEFAMEAFGDLIESRITFPILRRLDDVMVNLTHAALVAFSDKRARREFSNRWDSYWRDRRVEFDRDMRRRRPDWDGEEEDVTGTPTNDGMTERAGTVSFEALRRATAIVDSVVTGIVDEEERERKYGMDLRSEMQTQYKMFETDPTGYVSDVDDAVDDFAREMESSVRPEHTVWGDRRVKFEDVMTTDEFQDMSERRMVGMLDDKENPYVYGSQSEYAMAMMEAYVRDKGFTSVDDLMRRQKVEREEFEVDRDRLHAEKVERINRERDSKGLRPLSAKDLPAPTDDEVDEWLRRRGDKGKRL